MSLPLPLAHRMLNEQWPTAKDGDRLLGIPAHWTAEEALIVCNFFEAAINAIWDRHGSEMADILSRLCALEQAEEDYLAASDDDADLDDDIPF